MLRYLIVSSLECKLESMGLKKHFTQYRYDTNFLYPTSYVYDPTNTKTETKGEISLQIMNGGSQAY